LEVLDKDKGDAGVDQEADVQHMPIVVKACM
jgi:hypothetical protein